jgi:hypothetical protein
MTYLSGWALEMKAHLKEFRPKMYRDLLEAGKLDEVCQNSADQAKEAYGQMVDGGMDPHEAHREARVQYLLLPSETDVSDAELYGTPGAPEDP